MTYLFDDFKCEPSSVLEAAAILVLSLIADRGEEGVQKVSVGWNGLVWERRKEGRSPNADHCESQ
jgi:hypothetical protein